MAPPAALPALLLAACLCGHGRGVHVARRLAAEARRGAVVTERQGAATLDRQGWLAQVAKLKQSDFNARLACRGNATLGRSGASCGGRGPADWCQPVDQGPPTVDVVVSTYDENISWLSELQEMNVTVYVHDRGTTATTGHNVRQQQVLALQEAAASQRALEAANGARQFPIKFVDIPNIGDEATGYLRHIIANYDTLPDVLFFVHGHRCAWHMPLDLPPVVRQVARCFSRDSGSGYVNLNQASAMCGMPGDRACYHSTDTDTCGRPENVFHFWGELLSEELGPAPGWFCMDCCAQFAVSRATVRAHPERFYQRLLGAATSGKSALEYFWRLIFTGDFGSSG